MNNYEFCAEFAAKRGGCVLDYGCGEGRIVDLLRRWNVDAYGCDVFYEGGDYSQGVPKNLMESGRVRRMEKRRIPFEDETFDVVVHNQVFEHVPDLDLALSEIARVLKPGGVMLGLFPDRSVWREGHCGVPFLHWFSKGSNTRVYYAFAFRLVGFGYFHGAKTRMRWSRDFCDWLDKWTYYRSYRDIREAFSNHFAPPVHIEAKWLDARLGTIARFVPKTVKSATVRRLAGMVLWCEKKHTTGGQSQVMDA